MGRGLFRIGAFSLFLVTGSCDKAQPVDDESPSIKDAYKESLSNGDRLTLPTGASPIGAAAADLNGDGMTDIAVVNQRNAHATIYLQGTDGFYTLAPDVKVIGTPREIHAASRFELTQGEDPNAPRTDLVFLAASDDGGSIQASAGGDGGVFNEAKSFETESLPRVILGDLDEDKWDDIVLVYDKGQSHKLAIRYNKGGQNGGDLKAAQSFDLTAKSIDVTLGDLNNEAEFKPDGTLSKASLDIVVLSADAKKIYVITQEEDDDGTPTYNPSNPVVTSLSYVGNPLKILLVDIDGDKILDAIVLDSAGKVHLLSGVDADGDGKGDGTFKAQSSFDTGDGPSAMDTGDLNGDGVVDIAIANTGDNTVSVLLGNKDDAWSFEATTLTDVGSGPVDIRIGEFGGTSNGDIAVVNSQDNALILLRH